MKSKIFLGTLLLILGGFTASAQTLPAGIYSPSFRWGQYQGLGQLYDSTGRLQNLGDTKSITFNAQTLSQVSAQAAALVAALNGIGSYELGNKLSLGTLKVDTKPEVQYFAPILAYGITNTWTLGIGFPIMTYHNDVQLTVEKSNIEAYRPLFAGAISNQLDSALQNTDLIAEVQKVLTARGYKPISSRADSYLGDVQIASLHLLNKSARTLLQYKATLGLPTGPEDDPDDLIALNRTHRTSLENLLYFEYLMRPSLKWEPSVAATIYMPDQVRRRVPKDSSDLLPDQVSTVNRQLGTEFSLINDIEWSLTRNWSVLPGVELYEKFQDSFTNADGTAAYFNQNTDSQATRWRFKLAYSSVQTYMQKESWIPVMANLTISDTIQGRNVEKRLQTELNLLLFF